MIHFKSIKCLTYMKYFLYDENKNVYYISTDLDVCYYRSTYYSRDKRWHHKLININLSEFLSEDIQIEYDDIEKIDVSPSTNDILTTHNKIYRRLQKIIKLS